MKTHRVFLPFAPFALTHTSSTAVKSQAPRSFLESRHSPAGVNHIQETHLHVDAVKVKFSQTLEQALHLSSCNSWRQNYHLDPLSEELLLEYSDICMPLRRSPSALVLLCASTKLRYPNICFSLLLHAGSLAHTSRFYARPCLCLKFGRPPST